MTSPIRRLTVWIGVIVACVALNVALLLPPGSNTGTVIDYVGVWLILIAGMYAVVLAFLRRGLRRLSGGDLRASDRGVVGRFCNLQDRHWPHLIEARSETLDGVMLVVYPYAARVAGLEGSAQAKFDVAEDGIPRNIEIVDATHPLFAKALLESLSRARGASRASPSNESRQIRINFALQHDLHDDATSKPSPPSSGASLASSSSDPGTG